MRKRKPIPEIPVAHTEDKPALVYHQVTTVEAWLKTKAEAERWLEARKAEGFTIKVCLRATGHVNGMLRLKSKNGRRLRNETIY